jgi:hypothetical protein
VHDFFHVLGLPRNAPISEIRRACARRVRRAHPDFRPPLTGDTAVDQTAESAALTGTALSRDAAVDFVDMASLLDRIQLSFFAPGQ